MVSKITIIYYLIIFLCGVVIYLRLVGGIFFIIYNILTRLLLTLQCTHIFSLYNEVLQSLHIHI